MTNNELLFEAKNAMQNAYSPYSNFKVGAAILTECGKVYTGCNIENASYGATICAERTAAVKAISEGHTSFTRIAIVGSSNEYTYPCGICRQFLMEFMKSDAEFVFEDKKEGILVLKASELLPYTFTKENIKKCTT